MTAIDGARLPGSIPNVPGATLELLELESVRTGRSRGELVALAVAAMFAPPIEDPAPLGEAPGQGTTRPPAPTIAHVYTDPDGDRLTLLAVNVGPADWSLVLTTADGEVERDVLVEDDETLAGIARAWLGVIEGRPR